MWIRISPNDTLFFRTGRPFTLGSETWAEGAFPPYPSTIYGALRTFLILKKGSLKKFIEEGYNDIGSPGSKGSMKIIGPIMCNNEGYPLFRVPYDLVKSSSKSEKDKLRLHRLFSVKKPQIYISDDKMELILLHRGKEVVRQVYAYLDCKSFKEYLECKKTEFDSISPEKLYISEPKIGIARNRITLTSKEAQIYRIPMTRLTHNNGLLVRIDEVSDFPENGLFLLGGEGKSVSFEKLSNNPLATLENVDFELKDGLFKLYLATPTIFKNGWLPKWINPETLRGKIGGIELQLVGCALGKCIKIGGWDIANNRPKPTFEAIPEGSVYYFKTLNGVSLEEIKEVFHMKNVSEINPEEGFGLAFVGGV
ncbi:MAG: type III-B CRISPR module-associated protein Cmr3 [candidate division WOR-3 bacterium]